MMLLEKITISRHFPTLAKNLALHKQNPLLSNKIILEFETPFLTPAILAMVASWILEMRLRGVNFIIHASNSLKQYLDGMGFDALFNPQSVPKRILKKQGFSLPFQLLHDSRDQMLAVDSLCEMILKQFNNARELLPSVEWAVNEITDNVFIHAQSPTPSVICAQYFPADRQVEIAIVDQGLGLLGTLGPSHGAQDEKEAIDFALKRGLTRDPAIGQGNGLAGTERIAELNRGELIIWTGQQTLIKAEERQYFRFSTANGVGIALRLNVDVPVDLSTTWIGQRPYTYIDRCLEDIDDGQALVVAKECGSVGSRDAARRLRNKLAALLPDVQSRITLDFSGCRDPSSSFLDELFGRLIAEIGISTYQQKIRIEGLKNSDLDRANVVIHQRLESMNLELSEAEYSV